MGHNHKRWVLTLPKSTILVMTDVKKRGSGVLDPQPYCDGCTMLRGPGLVHLEGDSLITAPMAYGASFRCGKLPCRLGNLEIGSPMAQNAQLSISQPPTGCNLIKLPSGFDLTMLTSVCFALRTRGD